MHLGTKAGRSGAEDLCVGRTETGKDRKKTRPSGFISYGQAVEKCERE